MYKLGDQVERYNRHMLKFMQTFEDNFKKIISADTIDDVKDRN